MNLKISYLYRDSGNYKTFGTAVFTNQRCIALKTVLEALRARLLDGEWFYPEMFELPTLFGEFFSPLDDPGWHEFESLEETEEEANYGDICFLMEKMGDGKIGWK